MSISSKMTAIADKIRAILGTAGAMGLDSMTNNLGTVQTNITDAFTAISNKGGSTPSSKVSSNLVAAIQSIPDGVIVQRATGTVAIDNNGAFNVNCGFLPDLVIIFLSFNEDGEDVIVFTPTERNIALGSSVCQASALHPNGVVKGSCTPSDVGFHGYLWGWNWDWTSGTFMFNAEYTYCAIKYT